MSDGQMLDMYDGGKSMAGYRETSPEFTADYEMQNHFLRLRGTRPKKRKPKPNAEKQKKLQFRTVTRIEIVQMADLPRYHYEIWADFDDGDSELLNRQPEHLKGQYVRGLKDAVRIAVEKWGLNRVELSRWHKSKHRPILILRKRAEDAEQ